MWQWCIVLPIYLLLRIFFSMSNISCNKRFLLFSGTGNFSPQDVQCPAKTLMEVQSKEKDWRPWIPWKRRQKDTKSFISSFVLPVLNDNGSKTIANKQKKKTLGKCVVDRRQAREEMLPAKSAMIGLPFSSCTAYRIWFTTCYVHKLCSSLRRIKLV